ncbi:MAG TPA: UDP-N-acetylmuramate dehydrogenase [Terracidiphilus sp.]|nr:UDP-N-acetylmuramate dehydrogenase [Terracidiphilus sp.]
MLLEEHKPLAPFTTFGIGGPARWFVAADTEDDVREAAAWAGRHHIPLFVLGGGSNLLVSDQGFEGLVLHICLCGIAQTDQNATTIFSAAAGEDWDAFVEQTLQANCAGIECLAGIPGTVGGTPVQNVGAYGQDVASTISSVRAFDLSQNVFVEFSAAECQFAYRRSRFNTEDRGRYIVTRVNYRLAPGGAPTLRYADLQRTFTSDQTPALPAVAEAVRRIRHAKGMLLVTGDPDCRSAGSFFKNPVVSFNQLRAIALAAGAEPPHFPSGPEPEHQGMVKLPAAWLIEQAGFTKGAARGAAGISSRHTLALVNRGGATAREILALAKEIREAVATRFQIHLEREPVLIGFGGDAF